MTDESNPPQMQSRLPKSRIIAGILGAVLIGFGVFLCVPAATCDRPEGDQHEFDCLDPVVSAVGLGLPLLASGVLLGLFAVLPPRRVRSTGVASAVVLMFVALAALFDSFAFSVLLSFVMAVGGLGYLVQRLHQRGVN